MPAAGIIAAVGAGIGAATAVVGTVLQLQQAKKARKAAKQQYAFERQLANNRAARQRIQAIREARLTAGAVAQAAENAGSSTSSAALGALGSIQSQLNSNLSFLDTNQKLADAAGYQASQVAIHTSKANDWAGVSNLGMGIFSAAGGFNAFKKA